MGWWFALLGVTPPALQILLGLDFSDSMNGQYLALLTEDF